MKTYVFRVKTQKEDDGRWSVWVPELPGCASYGNTKQEAITNIQEAAELYIEDMLEEGESLPETARVTKARAVNYPSIVIAA